MNYGVTDALAPFPLHSLVSTMTATINNNTVSMNTSEVLPALLRLCDPEDLAYYNDMTPTTLDYLGNYADGVERLPYQFALSDNNPATTGPKARNANNRPIVLIPGAGIDFPNTDNFSGGAPYSFVSYANNSLAFDTNRLAGAGKKHKPRGSYRILAMWSLDGTGNKRAPQVSDDDVYVQFEVADPLIMSPYIFGKVSYTHLTLPTNLRGLPECITVYPIHKLDTHSTL